MNLSVITSNISADFLSPPGVPPWDERKWAYVNLLQTARPDIIGLQEATPNQQRFLQTQLSQFTLITAPTDNPTPELVATWRAKYEKFGLPQLPNPYEIVLLYRSEAFTLFNSGNWWLSPTPDITSIGFGNVAPRVMVWAELGHIASGKTIIIFNTHIDHRSPDKMVQLCRERFASFGEKQANFIFIGDLNFNETDSNYALLVADGWHDTHDVAIGEASATFLYDLPTIPGGRIDHVFYRGHDLTPLAWNRLVGSGRVSDHDPVNVQFALV